MTGGIKGIGFGIAKSLREAGVKVAISGRNIEDVEQAKQEFGNRNVLALSQMFAILRRNPKLSNRLLLNMASWI